MKVIFLDVDGVLNSVKDRYSHVLENDIHLQLLSDLVHASGAKIVLSSSWRKIPSLLEILKYRLGQYGIEIYSSTRSIPGTRGTEIKDWIKHSNEPIESFVILDDDSDMDEYTKTNLVHTSSLIGMQPDDVAKAKEILQ